jgi:hypothetical protein
MTVSKAIISLLILLLVHQGSWATDSVDISACAIEGIELGDTSTNVRMTFGEPTGHNPPCIDCIDQPQTWISYDGLRVDFIQSETIHIEVESDAFRLPTGLGVGSTKAEVIAEYGDPLVTELEAREFLTYAITWGDGRKTAHTLDFQIHDDVVIGFKVGPKRTGSPYP